MNPQLQLLIDLQNVDQQLHRLEKKVAEIPFQIKELCQNSETFKLEYQAKVQAVENIEKEKRKKDRDLEVQESGLAKLKDQLLSVKTNREYQALLHEIESKKNDISKLEEEIILLIDESESIKKQTKEATAEFKASEERINIQKKDKEGALEGFLQEKEGLLAQKKLIEDQVPQDLLKRYYRIKEFRQGIAVVSVKEGSCQGCFMSLMPQLFQEVKQNINIYECPHCNRIVYFKEEEIKED